MQCNLQDADNEARGKRKKSLGAMMQDGRDRARAQDWQDWQDWRGWERSEGGGGVAWPGGGNKQDQGTRVDTSTNQPTPTYQTLWYQSAKMGGKGEGGRTLAPLPRAEEVTRTRRQHFGETGRLMSLGIWAVPPPPSHSHAANAHMGHQTRRRGCGRGCGRGRGRQMVHNGACGGIDVVVWWSRASLPCASIRRMKRLAQRAPR